MAKKIKESQMNLYYMKDGQDKNSRTKEKENQKKTKEREKRIKERNQNNEFDLETEKVIEMTNKNKIKKEQEKRKQITKNEKRRQKKIKKIKFFLKLIILLGIIVGGIIFTFVSPIFNIKEIKVLENNQISSDTIISLSGLKTEENIFRFWKEKVIFKIKENAYIENIIIHRKLPNTVEIIVKERVPAYSVDFMGKYAYINTQGYILEISEDSKQLPIILEISTEEEKIVPGNRLNEEDLIKLEDVIKIMSSARENNLDKKVTSIDISDKNEYSIYLEEEKKKVYLGDNKNLSNKMLYVVSIMEQEKEKEGSIYVNGDINNKFQPYFREKV